MPKNLNKPRSALTPAQLETADMNLRHAERYEVPAEVWVEDGHVFFKEHNGVTVSMSAEVAIKMGHMLGDAGADSLINRAMNEADKPAS